MNDRSNCPPKQTLIDFLLGKLEPGQVATCEQHLNDCKPCGDTIRGLDASDTFVGLATNSSPSIGDAVARQESDQLVVKLLIDKLEGMQTALDSSGFTAASPSRADEVINLLQPTGNPESMGRLAHYEIHELLGVGATSIVFRARDEQLHRDVALKVLRPSLGEGARERFLAEARAAAALNHENITTIYQVATEGHLAYMAQQWLPGETLEARLEREPELEIEEIKSISLQVAYGLAAAHAKNLIHRDIKPANIWIDSERNRAIILDFGLVRVADDEPQLTETGMIAGTPDYMSPEQTRGSEVDSRSDLFSLGCVMYRLCTGRLPFQAGNTLATLQAIQNDNSPPPRHLNTGIPREVSELVMMLLCKDIDGRPRTADQVVTALQDSSVMKELLADGKQYQISSDKQKPPPSRRWWLWGTAATLLFALTLLSGPQIVRVVTNQGVLEIESDDPNIAVEVLQGGEVIYVIDKETNQRLEIAAGTYKIQPVGDNNSFDVSQDTLTMKRGGKVVVTVTRLTKGELGTTPSVSTARSSQKSSLSLPSSSDANEHQLALADLSKRIKSSQDQLNRLTIEQQRVASALAAGPEKTDEHNRSVQELELELNQLSSKFGSRHPKLKSIQAQITFWKDYKVQIENNNGLDMKEILQSYLATLDQQIAKLNLAIEKDSAEFDQHRQASEQMARSANSTQRTDEIHDQLADRIDQIKIERETAEATLDWESAVSSTETIVELYKTLVSTAIELRELGEMTPVEVDVLKQELLHENSKLVDLRHSDRPTRKSVTRLEQQYKIALEKFDQLEIQVRAGEIESQKFWPSQLELYNAEANLHEARGHYQQAIPALRRIVETHQSILDTVVLRRDSGMPSEIGFVEATIGLENARARFTDFSRKYNLGARLPESKRTEIRTPEESNELTYDGRTFSQWMAILETERSPAKLETALSALAKLGGEQDSRQVVDAVMRLARVYGKDGEIPNLTDQAIQVFRNIPKEIVVDAILSELKTPNQNSGHFLSQSMFWFRVFDPETRKVEHDPEFRKILEARSKEFQETLFEIVDTGLASDNPEHLDWSAIMLSNLLTQFEFFKPDKQQSMIDRIKRLLPLIETDHETLIFVNLLTEWGENTSEYEETLLDLLFPDQRHAGSDLVSPYSSLVFKTLKEMGEKNTTDKTIQTVIKMLAEDKYWRGSVVYPRQGISANEPKAHAIALLGSLGEKASSALPVLTKIAENRKDPQSEIATQAIIRIKVLEHARDDASKMQGKWIRRKSKSEDSEESKGKETFAILGLRMRQYEIVAGAGAVQRRLKTVMIEFTDNGGEINLIDSFEETKALTRGIYQLKGDVLKLCWAKNAESNRPTSFDETNGQALFVLERAK